MKREKIINFKKYEDFKKDLEAGELLDTSIIFIDDLPGIYTHGTLFYCSSKPIISGELTPDPEEPEEPETKTLTVTFEFDGGIKDIDLYGKTISKNKITYSGETVEIEEEESLTWMANLKSGYDYGTNCNGSEKITESKTISMTTKEKWDGKYPVTFIFDEGIDYLTLSSKTIYFDRITYSGETYRVKEGELLYWRPTYKEGYEDNENCSGQMTITKEETITMTTKKIGNSTNNPTNEIWYTALNNEPINPNTDSNGNCSFFYSYDNLVKVVSNSYDEISGYCKLKVDNDIVYWNKNESLANSYFYYSGSPVTINYIPETIETIGCYFVKPENTTSIDINSLPNLKSISLNFFSNTFEESYKEKEKSLENFKLGDMELLEKIDNNFIYIRGGGNYSKNKQTIEKIELGNMPKLKTIGNYFIGVEAGAGNSPEVTLNINSIQLGDMSNVETIGDYFFGGNNTKGGKATINIETITLPSMPNLNSVGEGAFANNTVKTIYVPSDCFELYSSLFPSVKDKFIKI